jgi:hypothetical protein
MARKPRALSNTALWAVEDATAALLEIDAKSRAAHQHASDGELMAVALLLADIRHKAADARASLAKARNPER